MEDSLAFAAHKALLPVLNDLGPTEQLTGTCAITPDKPSSVAADLQPCFAQRQHPERAEDADENPVEGR